MNVEAMQKCLFVVGIPMLCIAVSLKCLLDVIIYKRVFDAAKLEYRHFSEWTPMRLVALVAVLFVFVLSVVAIWDGVFHAAAW